MLAFIRASQPSDASRPIKIAIRKYAAAAEILIAPASSALRLGLPSQLPRNRFCGVNDLADLALRQCRVNGYRYCLVKSADRVWKSGVGESSSAMKKPIDASPHRNSAVGECGLDFVKLRVKSNGKPKVDASSGALERAGQSLREFGKISACDRGPSFQHFIVAGQLAQPQRCLKIREWRIVFYSCGFAKHGRSTLSGGQTLCSVE